MAVLLKGVTGFFEPNEMSALVRAEVVACTANPPSLTQMGRRTLTRSDCTWSQPFKSCIAAAKCHSVTSQRLRCSLLPPPPPPTHLFPTTHTHMHPTPFPQMGPSGSGKTTLLDLLAGRKNSGTIEGEILFSGNKPSQQFLRRYAGGWHALRSCSTVSI